MEAKLQLRLAELDAKENMMLDDEQTEIAGRESKSYCSKISLKKYAKQLPDASGIQPEVSQPTFISANLTNIKDDGRTTYPKPVAQPTSLFEAPNFSSAPTLQPTTNPLNYRPTSTALPVIPNPCVMTNPAPSHRVTFPKERWTNYNPSRLIRQLHLFSLVRWGRRPHMSIVNKHLAMLI